MGTCLYSIFYFCMIVQNYPDWDGKPTREAEKLQRKNEVSACCDSLSDGHWCNCLLSYFCPQPRAAHTLDKVGICSFWPACVLMFLFPCCTLCYANACTELNERLGGKK